MRRWFGAQEAYPDWKSVRPVATTAIAPDSGSSTYTVSASTETRIAFCGSGTPGVLDVPLVLFSRPHAEASITTAADATSVLLARDIQGPLRAESTPRPARKTGTVAL